MKSSKFAALVAQALILPSSALLPGLPAQPLSRYEHTEPVMGTLGRITLYAPSAGLAKEAFAAAFTRIHELDSILSDYKPDSEIKRLCRGEPGKLVPVSGDLFTVLDHAQRLANETDGAFDVTIGPLTHLWRKARRERRLPTPEEIEAARRLTGFRKLTLDPDSQSAALATAGMQLDLGAIAKGYAAGGALDVLRNLGMDRALVAIGGDLCLGNPPSDELRWRIGIQSTDRVAMLRNTCISTSGGTEQFVEIGGTRYSHILDPRTGLGLTHRRVVTVIAPEGIAADGLATALSVLPPGQGKRLLRIYPGAQLY